MMGVYIKGMEMPKACVYRENGHLITCPLYDIDGYCGALNTEASHRENGKLSDCPLVPAADMRPVVRGKWINPSHDSEMCSACGTMFYISALFSVGGNGEPNFCPNCGADMMEES